MAIGRHEAAPPLALKEVIRFILELLTRWSQRGAWGQIVITVQDGQILTVDERQTYRGRLPDIGGKPQTEFAAR